MEKYFGTDGIRGIASSFFTPEKTIIIGRAFGKYLKENDPSQDITVCIGRDTRLSGSSIEQAFVEGLLSEGVSVKSLGILPTPAVARLVKIEQCQAGVVLSASHNPSQYNGIKVFDAHGSKLDDEQETRIEGWILRLSQEQLPLSRKKGKLVVLENAGHIYADAVIRQYPDLSLQGLKIAVDCAHGATWWTTPHVLEQLGARLLAVASEPRGEDINVLCGSTFPDHVEKKSRALGFEYDIAFTHDGDGDRVLGRFQGQLVDGDLLLVLSALFRKKESRLLPPTIVGTVMTNSGIDKYLHQEGIQLHRSPVGDRYVLREMRQIGAPIGGEQSGHLIYLDKTTTGDGLISLLEALEAVVKTDFRLLKLAQSIPMYAQTLLNVKVADKNRVLDSKEFKSALSRIHLQYPDVRIVVRPSGTEPLFRILAEAPEQELSNQIAGHLATMANSLA